MVAELISLLEELGEGYWPSIPALDAARVDRELQAAGWEKKGGSYTLAGGKEEILDLRVLPPAPAPPAAAARSAAAIVALLGIARLPLRKTILLDTAGRPPASHGDRLILAAGGGLEKTAAGEGMLLIFAKKDGKGPSRFPCPPLLREAMDALKAAGFAPELGVVHDLMGLEGLGFLPPGGPGEEGRKGFIRAVRACGGLLYGLAGYGALAFSFDD